ncbi:MAG: polyprenyl synthetase family protein [Acidobacteriota bacterium]
MSEGLHNPAPTPQPSLAAVSGMEDLLALVGPKLALVEQTLRRNLGSRYPSIAELGTYVNETGGKRIRPILVLLSSGMLGYRGELDVLMGAVFEFIHTATLVHDDIIDEADTRRGRPSTNRVFGNERTVLFGDFLYIRSMNMALEAGDIRLIGILAEATERMIEGEIVASHLRGRPDVTAEQHLEIVERKTAWLFSACCRVAAVLAGGEADAEERLFRYGMALGTAFQLVDDLLDLTADEQTLGKPVASDLREGRMTLPWIDLYRDAGDGERALIEAVVRGEDVDPEAFARLHRALETRGCLDRTLRLAERHATTARRLAAGFPDSPYRRWLERFPELILRRDR